ncbi:MAG: sulfide/dihydroorotate dehydrogenase-like FAD/NAD-binding protein [Bacteroidales bacterium]|jgi:NAD(P)H-flavin reductase|nr:sulfide/dihydroorotate dehydrogenase-like FAD/NAD-binding protein [Bacteroidales bacterium]MBR3097771.1 sulfide/dihydroorotate dehydrogenase-like FAD/NAD-binding protein [Bacteroidales bacterium]MBR4687186.1 sulfide/dihydroorotate dehydrogenase-like FAD/NAD-binding protein [Bacteroidales bacterium]
MFKIIEKEMLTPTICRMVVEAPRLAAAAKPGQFLIVRADEKGERIPLTISDFDVKKGTVTIVTQPIGASTQDIVAFEPGESFADVVGPLGNPSEFIGMSAEELAKSFFIFIAGGVGTAPVYPQAKWLHEHGAKVDVIIGAKTADLLIYKKEMAAVCDHLHICTDDGSEGFHGMVTALLEKLVNEGNAYTQAVAIGPMIMMKFTTLTAKKLGLPIVVSLNTLMVDGTGMCGACRVTVAGKTRFACVEGPEFNGYDVDFDEAMRRQGQYRTEETEARENHVCRIGRG